MQVLISAKTVQALFRELLPHPFSAEVLKFLLDFRINSFYV
jgi:hypothetical protein